MNEHRVTYYTIVEIVNTGFSRTPHCGVMFSSSWPRKVAQCLQFHSPNPLPHSSNENHTVKPHSHVNHRGSPILCNCLTNWQISRIRKAPKVASSWLSLTSRLMTCTGVYVLEPCDSISVHGKHSGGSVNECAPLIKPQMDALLYCHQLGISTDRFRVDKAWSMRALDVFCIFKL